MTPLAMQFLRERSASIDAREISDPDGMIDTIGDIHCFEMSAVAELAETVWSIGGTALVASAFLPAEHTWIELGRGAGFKRRIGFYGRVIEAGGFEFFSLRDDGCWRVGAMLPGGKFAFETEHSQDEGAALAGPALKMFLTMLAIINTPRLVERREHQPHRGLVRELRRTNGEIELRPWSEIRLEMTPRRASTNPSDPEHLSGRKCLHFCRSHLRVQNGRLVVVRPHWRGDSALGIKQQDYRVVA